jgi:hypothetical protein
MPLLVEHQRHQACGAKSDCTAAFFSEYELLLDDYPLAQSQFANHDKV